MSNIEHQVVRAVSEIMWDDGVTLETKLVDDLGADSIDLVEIVSNIEYKLNVEITEEEVDKIIDASEITVAEIVGVFKQYQQTTQ